MPLGSQCDLVSPSAAPVEEEEDGAGVALIQCLHRGG